MAGIEIDFDNVSDSPEDLAAVFAQLESGDSPAAKADPPAPDLPDPKEDVTKTDPADQTKQQAEQGQTATEAEPQGIATKDGKHVIPYSVLKGERDRASRAEQLATEMQTRVTALEALVKSGNQEAKPGDTARTNPQPPNETDLSKEDLESLKEDFPTVYKAVMASMAAAKTLEAKLAPVEDSVRQDAAERAQTATNSVQDAIDSVPKMAHIQANDANAFELAKQFDATLRTQPAWAERSLSERFQKVTEMVEAALGSIDLPATKPPSQPSALDLKTAAIAKAAIAVKATRSNVPTSLSEFPVGQHAAQDEREAAEGLSPLQLAEKFSSMSADQMDAYFQNL